MPLCAAAAATAAACTFAALSASSATLAPVTVAEPCVVCSIFASSNALVGPLLRVCLSAAVAFAAKAWVAAAISATPVMVCGPAAAAAAAASIFAFMVASCAKPDSLATRDALAVCRFFCRSFAAAAASVCVCAAWAAALAADNFAARLSAVVVVVVVIASV